MVTQLCMLQHVHTEMRQSPSYWMLALTLHGITMIFSAPSLKLQRMDSMRKYVYVSLNVYIYIYIYIMLKRHVNVQNFWIDGSHPST